MNDALDAVTESARERLRRCPYPGIRLLACEFEHGVLRLCGQLTSYYQKQIAQEIVADLSGVDQVVNDVVVSTLG